MKLIILLITSCGSLNYFKDLKNKGEIISNKNNKTVIEFRYPKEARCIMDAFDEFEYTKDRVKLVEILLRYNDCKKAATIIHKYVTSKSINIIKTLILCGYDADIKFEGLTPLERARSLNLESVINIINEAKRDKIQRDLKNINLN